MFMVAVLLLNILSLKGNVRNFKKTVNLLLIWSEIFLFYHENLFSEKNVSFIYSIIMLISKIACYLNRLDRALKLTSLWSKNTSF